MVLAGAACTATPEDETTDDGGVVEDLESAAEEAAEADSGSGAEGSGLGACDDSSLTAAMADLVDAAGVAFAEDASYGSTLECTWDDGTDLGPAVYLTIASTAPAEMNEELLESMGQEVIEDARFEGLGVVPAIVLGCEEANAATAIGCAVTVYGTGTDITIQVLMSEEATFDQIVEALWSVTEAAYA